MLILCASNSVKLLVHVFIGSRLAVLFEHGTEMTTRDKIINWTGMGVSGLIGLAVGFVIYRRTMERAADIAREQAMDGSDAEQGQAGLYADSESNTLLDPEDAAAIMSDDDLSMWETQGATFSDEESLDGGNASSHGHKRSKSKDLKFH